MIPRWAWRTYAVVMCVLCVGLFFGILHVVNVVDNMP